MRGRRNGRDGGVDERSQRLALQAVSVLLSYPDQMLIDRVPQLRAAMAGVPVHVASPLRRLLEHVESTPLQELQAQYTDVIDLRRRCCLYLTYFTHGDTRQRGMALLRFSHAYRSAGVEFTGSELPDYLPAVCEFAATADLDLGLRLLREHRAGLELVRASLEEARSAYVEGIDALRAVLGDASERDIAKALELARTGPPEEEVGLEPFGPPELTGMGARR